LSAAGSQNTPQPRAPEGNEALLTVRGGAALVVELPWPAAELRLSRQVTVRGEQTATREEVVARWGPAAELRRHLDAPRTTASWTGEAIDIAYVLVARSAEGDAWQWPVTLLPALPPAENADQPTPEQVATTRYGVQRRATRHLLAALSEAVLTLASLSAVLLGLRALLTDRSPGPGGWPGVVFGTLWLCAIAVIVVRRIRRRRCLGVLDTAAVALGGELRGRCVEGCLASLVRVEHYSVAVEGTATRGTARLVDTIERRYVGAGPWSLTIPAQGPASCGAPDGGVSWWVELETPTKTTRLPFTVLPWPDPAAPDR